MGLIAAKCTNCGANIEVDDSKEAGICSHCGTAFITEKVINNYVTHNHIVADKVEIFADTQKIKLEKVRKRIGEIQLGKNQTVPSQDSYLKYKLFMRSIYFYIAIATFVFVSMLSTHFIYKTKYDAWVAEIKAHKIEPTVSLGVNEADKEKRLYFLGVYEEEWSSYNNLWVRSFLYWQDGEFHVSVKQAEVSSFYGSAQKVKANGYNVIERFPNIGEVFVAQNILFILIAILACIFISVNTVFCIKAYRHKSNFIHELEAGYDLPILYLQEKFLAGEITKNQYSHSRALRIKEIIY
jgi:uncharacterized membrane protein